MKDNIKILIIPDVHGREFWREPVNYVLEKTEAKIIFLGDYLDCYPNEFEGVENYKEKAINNFQEIIRIKTKYRHRVTLLLGNHDCGYRFNLRICNCRTDYKNYDKIRDIFNENKDLFRLADESYINGKHYIFSHAGMHKGYVEQVFKDEIEYISEANIADYFNKAYLTEDRNVIKSLGMYDSFRGWSAYKYGSLIWADFRSWLTKDYDGYGYQIVGHTQLEHGCGGIIEENIADLDSAEAFVINDLGELKTFSNVG